MNLHAPFIAFLGIAQHSRHIAYVLRTQTIWCYKLVSNGICARTAVMAYTLNNNNNNKNHLQIIT